MSDQTNQYLDDSKEVVGKAGRAGRKTVQGGVEVGKDIANVASNPEMLEVIAIVIGVILGLVLIIAIVEGLNSAQTDENFYRTPVKEKELNTPEDDEEAYEANYDLGRAIKQTIDLSDVIHEEKDKERKKIEEKYQGATIVCESDQTPVLINEDYPEYFPSYDGSGAADGIQASIEWARKIANDDTYGYGKGGKSKDLGWFYCPICCGCTKESDMNYTCMPFVAAAFAHGTGDPLLNTHGGKKHKMTLTDWNYTGEMAKVWKKVGLCSELTMDDLQPGDVFIRYSSDNQHGHASIYAGNDEIIEASGPVNSKNRANEIRVRKGAAERLKDYGSQTGEKRKNYVMRYIGSGTGSSSASGSFQQNVVKWVNDTVALKKYRYKLYTSKKNTHQCPICHPDSGDGWNCIGFAYAAWHHGGGLDTKCSCDVINDKTYNDMYKKGAEWASKTATKKIGVKCKAIFNGGENIPASMMEVGDIMVWYNPGGSYYHTTIYIGSGKYAHSSGGSALVSTNVRYKGSGVRMLIRYAGASTGAGVGAYTKKDSFTVLDEVSPSTGKKYSIGHVQSGNTAQSFAYIGDNFAVAFVNQDHAPCYVQTYDKNGNKKTYARFDGISHANAACQTADGKFMVAGTMNPFSKTGHIFSIGSSVKKEANKSLPNTASSIAYDRETGSYILATSGSFSVYDSSLKTKKDTHARNMHGFSFCQDIGASNGYIFACQTTVKGGASYGKNYIDIYNEHTGDYCGSYYVSYGELESCDVVDGELVLLVHIYRSSTNYIHYTGIKVGTNQVTGSLKGYTTKSDLDLLSAYSVTISNTGLFKNEADADTSWYDKLFSNDIGTNNYTDLKGNRLKLYWFGKKEGRVNYKSDLKKKLGAGWFRKKKVEFYDILTGDEAIAAMEEDGVDPNATGTLGAGSGDASSAALAAVAWAKNIAADDSFCYGKPKRLGGYANASGCYFCNTNDRKIRRGGEKYRKTYMCQSFVTAAYAHGAGDPSMLKLCKNHRCIKCTDKNFQDYSCWKLVGRMKDLTVDDLLPGDVFIYYDAHASMYIGNGDMIDARSSNYWGASSIGIRRGAAAKSLKSKMGNSTNYVMRYVGSGSGSTSASSASTSSSSASEWNLVLVNRDNAVPSSWSSDLVDISSYAAYDGASVDSRIYKDLKKMLDDCEGNPKIYSAYRSSEDQKAIYDREPAATKNLVMKAGHSEHETGLSVDILEYGTSMDESQENEKAQKWLMKNCYKYGFILRYPKDKEDKTKVGYEPWHYRYVGKKAAKKIMEEGICLEEYLGKEALKKASSGDIIYLREKPLKDILEQMEVNPDDTYSGSGKDSMFAPTNLEAALGMSDNTEHALYTGYISINRNASSLMDIGSGDFGLPLKKGVYKITSHVGKRNAPTAGASTNHPGTDLGCPSGTPIYASLAGTVTVAQKKDNGGYGLYVKISSGDYEIIYAHMSAVSVNKGDQIQRGQKIGLVGSTGTSTGSHLHFEIHKNGKVVDPESLMKL